MKKFLCIFLFFGNILMAGTWSSHTASGMAQVYAELTADITEKHLGIQEQWLKIDLTLAELSKELKEKEKRLQTIDTLELARASELAHQAFLAEQEKKLLNTASKVEGVRGESSRTDELNFLLMLKMIKDKQGEIKDKQGEKNEK